MSVMGQLTTVHLLEESILLKHLESNFDFFLLSRTQMYYGREHKWLVNVSDKSSDLKFMTVAGCRGHATEPLRRMPVHSPYLLGVVFVF